MTSMPTAILERIPRAVLGESAMRPIPSYNMPALHPWSTSRPRTSDSVKPLSLKENLPDESVDSPAFDGIPASLRINNLKQILEPLQGLGMIQTALEALEDIGNIFPRLQDLAERAADPTVPEAEREAMDQEFQDHLRLIDEIASTTEYEGQKILDGTCGICRVRSYADLDSEGTISVDLSRHMGFVWLGLMGGVDTPERAIASIENIAFATEALSQVVDELRASEETIREILADQGSRPGETIGSWLA